MSNVDNNTKAQINLWGLKDTCILSGFFFAHHHPHLHLKCAVVVKLCCWFINSTYHVPLNILYQSHLLSCIVACMCLLYAWSASCRCIACVRCSFVFAWSAIALIRLECGCLALLLLCVVNHAAAAWSAVRL